MVPTLVELQLWLPLSHLTSMPSCENIGVGDSKTLTDQKIRQIAPILKEKIQTPGTASLTKQVQRGHRRPLQRCFG